MITCDDWPHDLSPLGWAQRCQHEDLYLYSARGMAPVESAELDALADTLAKRGFELFADHTGLLARRFEEEP